MKSTLSFLDKLTCSLSLLFALDRLAKLAAVIHFFHRPVPPQLEVWPTVTLLQPITRGANALAESLRARARLDYPASIQHLFICDTRDTESQSIIQTFLAAHPMLLAEIVLVETGDAAVASKIRKLQAALSRANGEILCFMDDDVAPRPDALRVVLPYLYRPGAGAAFGLPCYTNWRTPWSSLMSGLVNANMLLSFVALTYLAEPFRITGHIAAFRRDIFLDVGGLDGLEQHIDDDFEMARRLRAHGLRSVQTPLPSIVALLALMTRRRAAFLALGASLGIFGIVYGVCEARYLKGRTPLTRWPLLLLGALLTPLQIGRALLSNDVVEWRGQRLRVYRNGTVEVRS